MFDALYVAATGMHAEQSHIDTISNNLANLNTPAYKKSRISFDDLLYRDAVSASGSLDRAASSLKQGLGSSIASIDKVFTDGDLRATDNALDVAIRGQGFFEIQMSNGELAYTRNGALQVMSDGLLATADGNVISNNIRIPVDAIDVVISESGEVQANVEGDLVSVGQLELANFVNASSLNPIGGNLYLETEQSGRAFYSNPGENGMGELRQRHLEASNVDLVEELIDLTIAQRAYEVNAQVIRAADEMLQINNSLRR